MDRILARIHSSRGNLHLLVCASTIVRRSYPAVEHASHVAHIHEYLAMIQVAAASRIAFFSLGTEEISPTKKHGIFRLQVN